MKLPLELRSNSRSIWVVDAQHRIVAFSYNFNDRKSYEALVRKFNRDWRWVLFGCQSYEYTREDWLEERGRDSRAP